MRTTLMMIAVAALAGCTGLPETVRDGDPRDEIRAITAFALDDLRGALALAEANDDPIAAMCWGDLIKAAERLQSVADQKAVGVATKFQLVRNLRRNDLEACDALVNDARSTLFRIASRLGVAVP